METAVNDRCEPNGVNKLHCWEEDPHGGFGCARCCICGCERLKTKNETKNELTQKIQGLIDQLKPIEKPKTATFVRYKPQFKPCPCCHELMKLGSDCTMCGYPSVFAAPDGSPILTRPSKDPGEQGPGIAVLSLTRPEPRKLEILDLATLADLVADDE